MLFVLSVLRGKALKKKKSQSVYWKMNIGILEDSHIKEELDCLVEEGKETICNFGDWTHFKNKIRKWAKKRSRENKKRRRERITMLRNLIQVLDLERDNEQKRETKIQNRIGKGLERRNGGEDQPKNGCLASPKIYY